MEYAVDLLREHGITDIAVTLQYLPEIITDYFGEGTEFGVQMHYFYENEPLGTAGSIKMNESFFDDTFVVISGDALTDVDLTDAIQFHDRNQALVTLVLKEVEVPIEFGIVTTDESGRITRFQEKPTWSEVFSHTANTGIYIMEPDVLQWIHPRGAVDFSREVFPRLLQDGGALFGYLTDGYWSDIGNPHQYQQAEMDLLQKRVQLQKPSRLSTWA